MTRRETVPTGPRTEWYKSSFSANNSSCLEVKFTAGTVRVRDSKDHVPGPTLSVSRGGWAAFISALRG
ncbi:protein of unknown function [Amycolatopsis arida]|uniref:DUF397 domain-containing protein n=1 Tax=Amycolatopsis arida TaxID=587909 RepID=A0A1I5PG32_9PSEU|nr:DUF397 domain-containing protein [Amycolatopsis arida]TDX98480.1 uncharacterized protein DUF397 [Amycolatopsis arida]SFP32780.1 protein of unknown function [Amycolatopsis arida]